MSAGVMRIAMGIGKWIFAALFIARRASATSWRPTST